MIIYKNKKLVIPVGVSYNSYNKIDSSVSLQTKSITIVENGTKSVTPDEGFDGLGKVKITTDVHKVLQQKSVDSSTRIQEVTPDQGFELTKVTVRPYTLSPLVADSSTRPQSFHGQYGSVTVNPYHLDTLSVDSSTNTQLFEGQYGRVEVNPYNLNEINIDSSTIVQEFSGQYGSIRVNPYELDSSTAVIRNNGEYVFESSKDGLSRVDVSVNIDVESYYKHGYSEGHDAGYSEGETAGKEVQKSLLDSSTFTQNGTYTREDGWNEITVNVQEHVPVLQDKSVDSSTVSQIVTPDQGYDGLNTVTVNPYVLDSSSANINENGEYVFLSNKDGLSRVNVSVNIDTQSYYDQGYSAGETDGIAKQKALLDSSTITANGTYTRENGWNKITVDVPDIPAVLQNKTVDPSTNSQEVTPDHGYDGLSKVTVNPYELDSKTVDSSTNSQTVVSSKDGLSQVVINPYILDEKTVDSSTVQQIVESGSDGLKKVIVNPYTLNDVILDSSTNSQSVSGQYGNVTVNPYVLDSSSATIESNGVYTFTSEHDGLSQVTVDVNIDSRIAQSKTIDSSTVLQTIVPGEGYNALDQVVVNPYTLNNVTVDPSTNSQTLNGQYGQVTVNPYVLDSSTVDASTNDIIVTSSEDGLSQVTVTGLNIDSIYNGILAL